MLQVRSPAADGAEGNDPVEPRATDVTAFLRRELEAAYELMAGRPGSPGPLADIGFIESEVLRPVLNREFDNRKVPSPRR